MTQSPPHQGRGCTAHPLTDDLLEKNVVQLAPSALHATAESITEYLDSDSWQVNKLINDGIIGLDGPHERQIGMRLLGDGSSIQLWATGGTVPADHEPIEDTIPLPHGHRWHIPVHIGGLEADEDPGVALYNTITDRLLPVFDAKPLYVGHRPWDPPADLEADAAGATTPADASESDQPAPEPQTATDKQTRHLKAVPEPADQPTAEPRVPAEQPDTEATHAPQQKPTPKRTRRPKPAAPSADGEPKASTTRRRTAAKSAAPDADGKSKKPRGASKRTPAKPTADKPDAS
ncbi:hypothetical protein [Streptomyces sp. NPDC051677]|uniref:hypothetical protein n=1 Tax=Streptomyces sp. NPDC051677 TaxID=3365669 RepID=UPI0037CFF926